MIIIKKVLFILIAISALVEVIYRRNTLAKGLQEIYIRTAKKQKLNTFRWEQPWIRTLFRVIIIFSSIVFICMTYSVLFGAIYIR